MYSFIEKLSFPETFCVKNIKASRPLAQLAGASTPLELSVGVKT